MIVNKNGTYYTSDFDLGNHYEEGYSVIEKFDPHKIWSAVFFDADQGFYYVKRFKFEETSKLVSFIGETEGSYLVVLSGEKHPRFEISYGGKYSTRPKETIQADEFIGEKSYKARGKRLTTFEVKKIEETEPLVLESEPEGTEELNTHVEFEVTNPSEIAGDTEQMKIDFE